MKRILFKMLVVTGLMVGIANYVIYLQTGRMPVQEWVKNLKTLDMNPSHWVGDVKKMGEGVIDQVTPSKPVTVYKWTDADGVIHYGERPVDDNAEAMKIDTNRNLMSAPVVTDSPDPAASEQDQQAPIEAARAAAESMKARIEAQEGI